MAWYITDGALQKADSAPAENSILTDITGEGDVVIPDGVTSIEDSAFSVCIDLTSITIPMGVTTIGKEMFSACLSLTSAAIPPGVTSIGESAFRWCGSLTSVTIPPGVTSIGEWAFSECRSLTDIMIPSSVMSIGEGAFRWCESLTSITIPGNLLSSLDKAIKTQIKEIRCIGNVDKVPPALRPTVFATFAKHEAEYSQELKSEHIAVLKKSAARLAEAALVHPELLHLLCREKCISAKTINKYIEEATRRENIEATARLLNYKASVLTKKAVSKARAKKEQE